MLPFCAAHGLGFTPFGPLAGGWLAGRYRRGEPAPPGSRMTLRPEPYEHLRTDRTFDALDRFEHAARERGVEPPALAIAWLLGDPRVTAVVVGPRSPEQLEPVVDAVAAPLTSAEREEISNCF